MTATTHQGLYRNTPLVLGGLLGSIALLAAGVAAALHIASTGDELLPLVFGTRASSCSALPCSCWPRCAGIAGRSMRKPC
jgi:hypothetical protein